MQNPDVLFFFEGKPEELALYEEFEKKVLEELGQIKIKVSKTQISFANRHNFAFVSFLPVRKAKDRPAHYLTVSFGLEYQEPSQRIDAAVEPYPNRWTHHVMIAGTEEIDEELLFWIRKAAAFSERKRK